MWSWAPTSNSVYGNFPLYGRPSTTNIHGRESAQQTSRAPPQMQSSPTNAPDMTGAGGKDYYNQMPLPAGSYLPPNPQQYSQPQQQQNNYYQNSNSYYNNGSPSDSFLPQQNLQQHNQQPVMLSQNHGTNCDQTPDCGDMSQQPSVEYLYGEEAQKVLQQLQLSQFQQQNQARSPPQVATVNPVVRNKNPPSGAQAGGNGSVGDNTQVAAFGTDSTARTGPSGDGAGGGQLPESAPQSQQAAAVDPKPKPVLHQIVLPQQQSEQPQTTGPHFEISQPRPSPQQQRKGKKGQAYTKMQDYNQYYFNSYETPPYVTPQPQPIQPRVQQQQRLQEQAPRPSRKLSNMPTFHLCGRCTKCKMIQGDVVSSSGKNSFTFSKPPSGPVRPATSAPMARQMSATVFPQY